MKREKLDKLVEALIELTDGKVIFTAEYMLDNTLIIKEDLLSYINYVYSLDDVVFTIQGLQQYLNMNHSIAAKVIRRLEMIGICSEKEGIQLRKTLVSHSKAISLINDYYHYES